MKPHHWRETEFLACSCYLSLWVWFLIVLLRFSWNDVLISLVVSGYKWWCGISFIKSVAWFFIYQNIGHSLCVVWLIHCFIGSNEDIHCDWMIHWMFGFQLVLFVICAMNEIIEWSKWFLKQCRAYLRFIRDNLE